MSPWQKILYVKQPDYPDNYVDRTLFLRELKKNVTVKLYSYGWLVRNSIVITQQISAVAIFIAFFVFIYKERITAIQLIAMANTVTFMFYLAWLFNVRIRMDAQEKAAGKQAGKSGVLFMMVLLGLTPVLKTLTQDISSDSIWLLATLCLLVNLCFFDYATTVPTTNSDSLSLNAAIFASVMLASRLPSKPQVFGLLSIAVAWFALFPLIRRLIRAKYRRLEVSLTIVLITAATVMSYRIVPWLSIIFISIISLITFLLPMVYVYLQRYKNEIHGPWDEASVRLNNRKH